MASKKATSADCVFLVRHGTAEESHPLGDEGRALTEEGRRAFRDFAEGLAAELGLRGIATSPLVRAVQTAEILAEAAGVELVRSEPALMVDRANPARLTALAKELGPGWALVGHNPSLGSTLGTWLGLDPSGVQFRKGAIAALRPSRDFRPPFELVFIASPGHKKQKTV